MAKNMTTESDIVTKAISTSAKTFPIPIRAIGALTTNVEDKAFSFQLLIWKPCY